jgi:acyl carrier protein
MEEALAMTEAQILQRLGEIVSEVLGEDDVALSSATTAKEVEGWDSVTNVQIMVAVEQAFRFRFRTGELAGLRNVGELVGRICGRMGE